MSKQSASTQAQRVPEEIKAFGALTKGLHVEAIQCKLRELRPSEITIKVSHCGICHSDIHHMKDEWTGVGVHAHYPLVAGHEVIGEIVELGSEVKDLKIGDRVGFGGQRSSCGQCEFCNRGEESLCKTQETLAGPLTGGFGEYVRANARFAFRIPDAIESAHAAPLLCAGVTVFSPLQTFKPKPGSTVGVHGIGGLGHMAVQFASAMGFKVVALSASANKAQEAKELGAQQFVNTKNEEELKKVDGTIDLLLMTASASVDYNRYMDLLRPEGKMCILGVGGEFVSVSPMKFVFGRKSICGSLIGGVRDMTAMFEFAAKNKIKPLIEVAPLKFSETEKFDAALLKVDRNDVRYRLVVQYQN